MELCKTRFKKSTPDMFNFYVVLAGHDMVTDSDRVTIFSRKVKAPLLQTESTKNEGRSENMGFTENPFEDFRGKNFEKETILSTFMKQPSGMQDPKWNS